MSDARVPARLPKLPFYIADLVLSAIAVFVLYRLGTFEGPGELGVVAVALAASGIGAWFSIIPWLSDYRAQAKVAESANLASALEQIKQVEQVADQIRLANSQWQGVQDSANRTVKAAGEISDKIRIEAQEFSNFLKSAHDQERAHLRLEVEKMKRSEAEWLKVVVQIMDHVHALAQAGERSGQPALIAQLQQFQNACRDVSRRIGLAPFAPAPGEPFEERAHQVPDSKFKAPEDSRIGQVLATGYTFQGQLLRRALVLLANPEAPLAPAPESTPAAGPETAPAEPAPERAAHQELPPDSASPVMPSDAVEPEPEAEPKSEAQVPEESQPEPQPASEPDSGIEPMQQAEKPAAPKAYFAEADPFEEIEPVNWEEEPARPQPSGPSQPSAAPESRAESTEKRVKPGTPKPGSRESDPYPRQLPLV